MHIASTGAPFVKFMRSMMKYLHETVIAGEGLPEAPLHTVAQERGAKVRLDTQPVVWVETLTVPRGMSRKSAKEVAKRYPSAAALLAEYRKTRQAFEAAEAVEAASSGGKKKKKKRTLDDALDAMLEDVPLQNGKRLGPAASRTIRRTFLADGDV
jgi:dihydroxyacetone kinase-like predicted kinase